MRVGGSDWLAGCHVTRGRALSGPLANIFRKALTVCAFSAGLCYTTLTLQRLLGSPHRPSFASFIRPTLPALFRSCQHSFARIWAIQFVHAARSLSLSLSLCLAVYGLYCLIKHFLLQSAIVLRVQPVLLSIPHGDVLY